MLLSYSSHLIAWSWKVLAIESVIAAIFAGFPCGIPVGLLLYGI
jgi:hypothetical protein